MADSLPRDILLKILTRNGRCTQLLSSLVCKTWYEALKESLRSYPTKAYNCVFIDIAESAASRGRINIIEWLYDKHPFHKLMYYLAAKYKQYEVLEWLLEHNIPGSNELYNAAINGRDTEVFEWGIIHGVARPEKCSIIAAKRNQEYMMEWIIDNLGETLTGEHYLVASGLSITKWLHWRGVVLDEHWMKKVIMRQLPEHIKWLYAQGVKIREDICRIAAKYNAYTFIWAINLKKDGQYVFPRSSDLYFRIINKKARYYIGYGEKMLKALLNNGVYIDDKEQLLELYKICFDGFGESILNWLFKHFGIVDDSSLYEYVKWDGTRKWLDSHIKIMTPTEVSLPLPLELIEIILFQQSSVMKIVCGFVCKEWYCLLKRRCRDIRKYDIIYYAIDNNFLKLAKWGIHMMTPHLGVRPKRGRKPKRWCYMESDHENVVATKDKEIIKKLYSYYGYDINMFAAAAILNDQLDELEWLASQGAVLDNDIYEKAIFSKNTDILDWLYSQDMPLSDELFSLAVAYCCTPSVIWFITRGKDIEIPIFALSQKHACHEDIDCIIEWIREDNIPVKNEVIEWMNETHPY